MTIKVGDVYRNGYGKDVTIMHISKKEITFPVVGYWIDDYDDDFMTSSYTLEGKWGGGGDSDLDILIKSDDKSEGIRKVDIKVGDIYKNKLGRDIEIIYISKKVNRFPIIGFWLDEEDFFMLYSFTLEGKWCDGGESNPLDLLIESQDKTEGK